MRPAGPTSLSHNDRGVALKRAGRFEEAIDAYRRAIALDPNHAAAHNNLGNALSNVGQMESAIEAYRRAIELKPEYAEAYNNLATVLTNLDRPGEAIAACQTALKFRPDLAEIHNSLGAALAADGQFDKAIDAHRAAIALKPAYAEAHINLCIASCYAGHGLAALPHGRRAIELQPNLAKLHSNFSMILLALGQYEQGWIEHEWRWKVSSKFSPRPFAQPQWFGEPIAGKTILLHAEQGFGDTIQFVRYAPLVADLGAKVILECRPELIRLLADIPGISAILPTGDALPDFDIHCPLMSLPLAFRTTLESIPSPIPVPPRSGLRRAQSSRRPEGAHSPGPQIGLVWAGRPTHSNDTHRSMHLAHFAPLASLPHITFHSLQKGPTQSQLEFPPTGLRIIDHAAELSDFVDAAALIARLDLVISVDTAVAHLAGSLGKPVWLLLPFVPDWRWMRDRSDSLWYPTMRIFRQPRFRDWSAVVEQVKDSLPPQ